MKKVFRCLTIMALPVLAANSSTPSAARETITVSRRPWFAVCVGLCPYYDVTVWADGRVLAKRRGHHEERFRVSRSEAADFRDKLRPFRPASVEPDPLVCSHDIPPEDAPLLMKVKEIEIGWSGTDHPARLAACDNAAYADLMGAIRQALGSAHLDVSGQRRD